MYPVILATSIIDYFIVGFLEFRVVILFRFLRGETHSLGIDY